MERAFFSNAARFLTEPSLFPKPATHAARAVTGQAAMPDTGGDTRFIGNSCPAVEFGPLTKTIHHIDERIALGNLTPVDQNVSWNS